MADSIAADSSTTSVISIGQTLKGNIDFQGDRDWWKLAVQLGYGYQVWLEGYYQNLGTLIDPYLAIYNGNGIFSFSNDDASFLSYYSYTYVNISSSGNIFLSAEESGNNAIGSYALTAWRDELASLNTAAAVQINSINEVYRIGWQNDTADWFGINFEAGIAYQIDLIGIAEDGGSI